MKYRITKEHVWAGLIDDRPGALGEKLRDLSMGGLDLELIITRRELSGRATMFVSPLRTVEELEVAAKAGLARAGNVRTIRIEGPNGVGLGAKIAMAIADAGISMHGFSAAALGDRQVTNIAFDSDDDGDRAKAILEELLG
ncbi:MAG: hypothetical protein JXO22_02810 [Phycisphaerae bacterium]|nr:hypothetical protein [Phycisphaerae bacterium]